MKLSPPPPGDRAGGEAQGFISCPICSTAGNLFCGFVALTKIVEADLTNGDFQPIRVALRIYSAGLHF